MFVSPNGDDSAAGTQAHPFKTLGHALGLADAGILTVYACETASGFNENVAPLGAATLYGGLDCSSPNWTYKSGATTTLTAPPDSVPLTVSAPASGTTVYNFVITAAPASLAGGSSTAVAETNAVLLPHPHERYGHGRGGQGRCRRAGRRCTCGDGSRRHDDGEGPPSGSSPMAGSLNLSRR